MDIPFSILFGIEHKNNWLIVRTDGITFKYNNKIRWITLNAIII